MFKETNQIKRKEKNKKTNQLCTNKQNKKIKEVPPKNQSIEQRSQKSTIEINWVNKNHADYSVDKCGNNEMRESSHHHHH